MVTRNEQLLWLTLRRVAGLGPIGIGQKWRTYGSVQRAWDSISIELTQEASLAYQQAAEAELEQLEAMNIWLLTLDSPGYPENLKNLADAPPVLYVKGGLRPEDSRAVSVVGTRSISGYGRDITQGLAGDLARSGFTVVSGLARGVDSVAHRAVMDNGGRTIAVLGCGLDMINSTSRDLANEIMNHGAVVSQFPLGTQPQSFTFPARNKVIAGLGLMTVVTEARLKSGALLTAEAAAGYGRPVAAMPGSIYNQGAMGPHLLIKSGSQLIVDVADIVETLGGADVQLSMSEPVSPIDVTTSEQAVLAILQSGPMHIDDIIRHSRLASAETASALALLELKGLITQVANKEYRRV